MRLLDYIKKYHNLDLSIVLMDELGYSDDEITSKLEIARASIYNAKTRFEPLLNALSSIAEDKPVSYGDPAVNAIVEAFKDSFGTTKVSKYDRYAAKRLATKHGADRIIAVIKALSAGAGDKFAPSINNVSQLEEKFVSVGKFLQNKSYQGIVEL